MNKDINHVIARTGGLGGGRSFLRSQYSHIGSSGADRHGDVGFEEFHTLLITTNIDNEHAERQSQKTSAANFRWAAFSGWLVVCVCCLLYTSPSPRDRHASRMPSSA